MALENAHLEDSSEFEPDSNFFDNFLDGMDVLIDNCRDPKDEQTWMDEESDCSSGADRMVIDLPSSPESRKTGTAEEKNSERSDIKDVLTNRVLAQLEKSSSIRRNKVKNSFPSSQLVVDVLDRLKKSVQLKTELPLSASSTRTAPHPEISRKNHSISIPVPTAGDAALGVNSQGGILSKISTDNDGRNGKQNQNMSQLFRWIFSENTSRYEHPYSTSGAKVYEDKTLDVRQDKRKRRTHKKHKSAKSKYKHHSKKHRHHKTKSKKRRGKKTVEEAKISDFSLESVSSENEDDILNKQHSDEERVLIEREGDDCSMTKSPKSCEYAKRVDCEEGEVLSSSSDWECQSDCVTKKMRGDLKSYQIRPDYLSPSSINADGPWSRRFHHRRTPPSPSWPGIRLHSEDHGKYVLRRTRSPVRMSPTWREQSSDRPRLRIPPLLESLPPVAIPLRPRSPDDRLASALPRSFVDSFGYPIETLKSRRADHVLHPFHRPRSPWEEVPVRENRHLFKPSSPIEIHPREVPVPCPPLRIERRFPAAGRERRKKPGLLLRCLQEIRHRSYKPGRFVYDPESEALNSAPSSCPIGLCQHSSPLHSSRLKSHALSFTTPNVSHIGTISSSFEKALPEVSVGCQTRGEDIFDITEEQVEKNADPGHIEEHKDLPVLPVITDKSPLNASSSENSRVIAPSSALSEEVQVEDTTQDIYSPPAPAQSNTERKNIIQQIVSQVSVSKTISYPTSLEMWKTIVSFRYPDLSDKEREQVVLVKSMESKSNHGTETA